VLGPRLRSKNVNDTAQRGEEAREERRGQTWFIDVNEGASGLAELPSFVCFEKSPYNAVRSREHPIRYSACSGNVISGIWNLSATRAREGY
jgi:hypothetical protein